MWMTRCTVNAGIFVIVKCDRCKLVVDEVHGADDIDAILRGELYNKEKEILCFACREWLKNEQHL